MNKLFKKTVALVASMGVLASTVNVTALGASVVSAEFTKAFTWAQTNGITSATSEETFNAFANVTREQSAKMIVNGLMAASCVKDKLKKTKTYNNEFTDLATADASLQPWIKTAYEHGLINGWANKFHPFVKVSRAQVMTIIGRALYGKLPENNKYWANYYKLLKAEGIFTVENATAPMKRYELVLVLYRIANNCGKTSTVDVDKLVCQLVGTCDKPGTTNPTTPTTPTTPNTPTKVSGKVVVNDNNGVKGDKIAKGASIVAGSFDVKANTKDDVMLYGVTIKRTGLFNTKTVKSVSAYVDGVRVSKSKRFNSDNVAFLTFSSGVKIKDGKTAKLELVAEAGTDASAASTEFALEITKVDANADVTLQDVTGPTFQILNVNAAMVKVLRDGSIAKVSLGDTNVAVASFKLEGDNDRDIEVRGITITDDKRTAKDAMKNFKLYCSGKEVASLASANDRYVSFVFADKKKVLVEKRKTVRCEVRADIVGEPSEDFLFYVDSSADVWAEDTDSNRGIQVDIQAVDHTTSGENIGATSIEAGDISLSEVKLAQDEARINSKDVTLAKFKITAAQASSLEKIWFNVTKSGTGTALSNIIENVELHNLTRGTRYDLTFAGDKVGDNAIDLAIPAGKTYEFALIADIKNDTSLEGVGLSATLRKADMQFVETSNDQRITDVTPAALDWKRVSIVTSGVTVNYNSIANINAVVGTKDVLTTKFQIKAGSASNIKIEDLRLKGTTMSGTTSGLISDTLISKIALYEVVGSKETLIDTTSRINTDGTVRFDNVNLTVKADTTRHFVVKADLVKDSTNVNKTFKIAVLEGTNTGVVAVDAQNDTVNVIAPTPNVATITVKNVGKLALTASATNIENKYTKTILGGESMDVFSLNVLATNEEVKIKKITFTVDKDLRGAVNKASLYLDGKLIATNTDADVTATTIAFADMNKLIVPEAQKRLTLRLHTNTMGYQKIGKAIADAKVTGVSVVGDGAEGVSSGRYITDITNYVAGGTDAKVFSIVPAVLNVSVVGKLNNGAAKIKVTANVGGNTQTGSNTKPNVTIAGIVGTELGNNTDGYKFYNEENVANQITAIPPAPFVITGTGAADMTVSTTNVENFFIIPVGTVDKTYALRVARDAITYTVEGVTGTFKTALPSELDLGTKTY